MARKLGSKNRTIDELKKDAEIMLLKAELKQLRIDKKEAEKDKLISKASISSKIERNTAVDLNTISDGLFSKFWTSENKPIVSD